MSSSPQPKPPGGGDRPPIWQRWSVVLPVAVGLIAALATLVPWLWPRSSGEDKAKTPSTQSASLPPGAGTSAATATTAPGKPAAGFSASSAATATGSVFLDSYAFAPDAGAENLVAVPRGVTASHALAVKCPTNETGRTAAEVRFVLRSRYHRFDATVHPYYPKDSDQQAVTYVTALIGTAQPDGTQNITRAGSQKRATMASPLGLTATVDGAADLTIQVECQNPNGTIILSDARLTP